MDQKPPIPCKYLMCAGETVIFLVTLVLWSSFSSDQCYAYTVDQAVSILVWVELTAIIHLLLFCSCLFYSLHKFIQWLSNWSIPVIPTQKIRIPSITRQDMRQETVHNVETSALQQDVEMEEIQVE